jgi:hypothetical protein
MTGYREHGFDPMASPRRGRPLRPYNWVQWTGVGLIVLGLAAVVLYVAGRLGWMFKTVSPVIALPPIMAGAMLVNSRREQVVDPAPELAAARKRWLIIVTIFCVVVLGAAAIIDFKGA